MTRPPVAEPRLQNLASSIESSDDLHSVEAAMDELGTYDVRTWVLRISSTLLNFLTLISDTNLLKIRRSWRLQPQQGMILLCLTILEMETGLSATSSARHKRAISQTSRLSQLSSQLSEPGVATDGVQLGLLNAGSWYYHVLP